MASNQRENERAARKHAKARKNQIIIWSVLAVLVILILIIKISEIDFDSVKNNVTDENGKFSISALVSDNSKFPFSLDSSADAAFSTIGNQLAVLGDNSFTVIDSSNARLQFRDTHGFANPIMKISGDYAVIIDQGTNKYRLDTAAENVYKDKSENTILCADVSNSGVVALATTSSEAKSEIVVYNKAFKEKMKYNVNYGYVTALAIDDSASRVAFAAVNSENARLKTIIYTMNINDEVPRAEIAYEASNILDLHFSSSDLYIVGSDFISVVSSLKDEKKVLEQGACHLTAYSYTPSDELVIAYSDYNGSSADNVALIAPSGKIKAQLNTGERIKDVASSKSKITILTSDYIITYNAKGEEEGRTAVDDSYTSITQLSSSVYAKHQSLVEIFKR